MITNLLVDLWMDMALRLQLYRRHQPCLYRVLPSSISLFSSSSWMSGWSRAMTQVAAPSLAPFLYISNIDMRYVDIEIDIISDT